MGTKKGSFNQSAKSLSSYTTSSSRPTFVDMRITQKQKNSVNRRPRLILNHFEGHKELTRKDDLLNNLKTQLNHEQENLFEYTPISFLISIPEGRYQSIDAFIQKFLATYEILNQSR